VDAQATDGFTLERAQERWSTNEWETLLHLKTDSFKITILT